MTRTELLETAKPILFNTKMVRAILDNRKTVTRRVVKPHNKIKAKKLEYSQGDGLWIDETHIKDYTISSCWIEKGSYLEQYAPYKVDDYLYVRETFSREECTEDCEGRSDPNECPFNRIGDFCYGYKTQYITVGALTRGFGFMNLKGWKLMEDYSELEREYKATRAAIRAATKIAEKAKADYIKKQLKARSLKQANDMDAVFEKLADYDSTNDIENAYGYDYITLKELDQLLALWEKRKITIENNGKYRDRIVDILEVAIRRIGDEYIEKLDKFEQLERENHKNVAERNRF